MKSVHRAISGPRFQTLIFLFLVFFFYFLFVKPREYTTDVEIVSNFAYLASGTAGISIIDISDPANPRHVGSYNTPGTANQVAINENNLYVADGRSGLIILDITDPAAVHQIGSYDTPGEASDISVKGKNIFIADGRTGLVIVNMNDPSNPTDINETGRFETQGQATRIVLDGNFAYVSDNKRNLTVLDISTPSTPNNLSNYQAPSEVLGIAINNGLGYLAAGESGLIVLNLENPSNPTQLALQDTPGIAKSVAISGNYAFIADSRDGIQILEINNPENIAEVGKFEAVVDANDLAVKDQYIYLADGYEGLNVLDQQLEVTMEMISPANLPGNAEDVTVQAHYAYLASESQGVRVLDISQPQQPFEVGLYDTPGQAVGVTSSGDFIYVADREGDLRILFNSSSNAGIVELAERSHLDLPGEAYGILVDGRYGYVASGKGGLRIINLEDPGNPKELGSEERAANAVSVAVLGEYAYVAGGTNGLYVVNITDRSKPAVIGYIDTPGEARAVNAIKTTSGTERTFVYLADGEGGVRVIEATNPRQLIEVGSNTAPEFAYDISLVGNLAFVSGRNDGLWVMDIIDPINPKEIGFYDTPGEAHGINVQGANVFIADYERGMRIVDATNPTSPTPIGFYDVPRLVSDVLVDEHAYLIDSGRGLRVVDVNNPREPREIGFYDSPGRAQGLAIQGNYAYLGVEANLKILDIAKPTTPFETGSFGIPAPVTAVYVAGDYAYMANGVGGLRIVNILDKALPGSAGTFDTPGNALDVVTSGNYAYIADQGAGLSVVNISDPNRPQTASLLNQYSDSHSVLVLGNIVYLADGINGVFTINVEKPAAPEQVSSLDTPGVAQDLAASNNFLFIADGQGGIQVFYILHPGHLITVGSIQPAGESAALDVVPKLVKKGEPFHFYVYVASNESGLRIFDASQKFEPTQIGFYSTPGVYPIGRTIREAIPSMIAVIRGEGGQVPDKLWRSLQMYTFDFLVFTVTLVFWMGFVSQFVLPVQTYGERLQAIERLFSYMIGRRGPGVYIKGGSIFRAQGAPELELADDPRRPRPGVLMVDASSAAVLKYNPPSVVRTVQGPGLELANNRRIVGMADLRRQVRTRNQVHAFTRDGIEVMTNVVAVSTLGEAPEILHVAFDGPTLFENLKVIDLQQIAPGTFSVNGFRDELDQADTKEIITFAGLYAGPFMPYVPNPVINPGPPFVVNPIRIFAAVSSEARDVSEELKHDWSELPAYAAAAEFRNLLSQELYDNLYLPKDPENYPLNTMKAIFLRTVRNLGILSYQFVERSDGNTLVSGQILHPGQFTCYPVMNLVNPKVLRDRGIKVISAGFSDLEPTSEKVKERLMDRWSAGWEKEATIINADYELQAMRVRNLARAEAQGEMVAALALILNNTPLSEHAMAVRVFQALELAATDPNTRKLLPAETITMLKNLKEWL